MGQFLWESEEWIFEILLLSRSVPFPHWIRPASLDLLVDLGLSLQQRPLKPCHAELRDEIFPDPELSTSKGLCHGPETNVALTNLPYRTEKNKILTVNGPGHSSPEGGRNGSLLLFTSDQHFQEYNLRVALLQFERRSRRGHLAIKIPKMK